MTAVPLGEFPDIEPRPRPTIVAATQDADRLTTRNAELEADNDHLAGLLREVRNKNAALRGGLKGAMELIVDLTQERSHLQFALNDMEAQRDRVRGERDVAAAQAAWGRMTP